MARMRHQLMDIDGWMRAAGSWRTFFNSLDAFPMLPLARIPRPKPRLEPTRWGVVRQTLTPTNSVAGAEAFRRSAANLLWTLVDLDDEIEVSIINSLRRRGMEWAV